MNFLGENIRVEIRVWKVVSYDNYIIILSVNSTLPLLSKPSEEKVLTYLNYENDMIFQNNPGPSKVKLNKIGFIYHYEYLENSLSFTARIC